jgi:LysR family transcriptional regulator for bpeEF and oprC
MDYYFCMRAFARVVELGSFARAADHLEISRPTATTAVAQLEKRLGVRLLHRTTRRLSLTDDGRTFYERCVRILGDIAETEDSLSSARVSPRGLLRVSTPHSFVHRVFFSALPRFLARYPELNVEVVLTDRAVNLVEEGIDCAVRGVEIPGDSTLVARQVTGVRWVTCASPVYLAARGTPQSVADLERHNCVRFISPSTGRTADWRFRKGEERITFTPRGNLGVTSLEAAAAAALHGTGIAQVPDSIVILPQWADRLQPILLDWVAPAPPLNVVYPSNRYLTAKVRAFADFVSEIFAAKDWWPEIDARSGGGSAPAPSSGRRPPGRTGTKPAQ